MEVGGGWEKRCEDFLRRFLIWWIILCLLAHFELNVILDGASRGLYERDITT